MSNPIDPTLSTLAAAGLGPVSKPETSRGTLGQQEFFDLLIAQLKHQDPLKPLESNEFLGQVAQFSTVSGIQEMQKSFAQMAASLQSGQALQASTLVGRKVLVAAAGGVLAASGNLEGAVDLPASSGGVSLTIRDAVGRVVRQLELGAQQAGMVPFRWDGTTDNGVRAPAGAYSIAATASLDDRPTALETLVAAQVESVTLGRQGSGMNLNLAGFGPIGLSEVRQLL